ncbi:MAG: IS3 family transposase [Ruminococcus sp.]|nr:IS3 family transposase [Ruminococcus sp.]
MYWQKRLERLNPNKEIEELITELHFKHENYGYRRMTGELRKQGILINKNKVQRIMQKRKFQVTSFTRKSRKYNSYKGKVETVAPNRIRRIFKTSIFHQKITTDTTEFKYYEIDSKNRITMRKLYLDPYMDLFNGDILSFSIDNDKHPSAANVMYALNEAIKITSDCSYRRTFHSDQSWAYQMKAYSNRLKEERIYQRMSRGEARKSKNSKCIIKKSGLTMIEAKNYYGFITGIVNDDNYMI